MSFQQRDVPTQDYRNPPGGYSSFGPGSFQQNEVPVQGYWNPSGGFSDFGINSFHQHESPMQNNWNSAGGYAGFGIGSLVVEDNPTTVNWKGTAIFVLCVLALELINLVFGTIGSVFSTYVFSRKPSRRSSIDVLLMVISVAELILTLAMIALYVQVMLESNDVHVLLVVLCFKTVKAYLLVTVAAERYLAVCMPLQALALLSPNKSRNIAVGIFVVVIIYHLIAALYDKDTIFYAGASEEMVIGSIVRNTWVYLTLTSFIPMVLLTLLHVRIIYQLYSASRRRSRMTSQQLKDRRVATMLFLETILFVLFSTPFVFVVHFKVRWSPNLHIQALGLLGILFMSFSSTTSPIIYYIFLAKYQDALNRILKTTPAPKPSPTTPNVAAGISEERL